MMTLGHPLGKWKTFLDAHMDAFQSDENPVGKRINWKIEKQ